MTINNHVKGEMMPSLRERFRVMAYLSLIHI